MCHILAERAEGKYIYMRALKLNQARRHQHLPYMSDSSRAARATGWSVCTLCPASSRRTTLKSCSRLAISASSALSTIEDRMPRTSSVGDWMAPSCSQRHSKADRRGCRRACRSCRQIHVPSARCTALNRIVRRSDALERNGKLSSMRASSVSKQANERFPPSTSSPRGGRFVVMPGVTSTRTRRRTRSGRSDDRAMPAKPPRLMPHTNLAEGAA
mmetsp:Transcript_5665/g.15035  ORF Transcript_5665/g.15035 Transcript_5665/m.15035 type:complete len:215 (+) Transcript_5665:2-646(+)